MTLMLSRLSAWTAEHLGIHDIAQRFAHLEPAGGQETMAEHTPRQRQAHRHQHAGPVYRMESQDVLPNDVHLLARPDVLCQKHTNGTAADK
jgi:hypothetical protein